MKEECIVLKVSAGRAFVALAKADKCGGCRACAFGRGKKISLPAIMDVVCKQGDTVLVEMPQKESSFSLLLFVIPLLALAVGFFIGGLLGGDLARILTSLAFCAGSVAAYIPIERVFRRRREFMPIIIAIVDKNSQKANADKDNKKDSGCDNAGQN